MNFSYDHESHWVTDNEMSVIAVATALPEPLAESDSVAATTAGSLFEQATGTRSRTEVARNG